MVIIIRKRSHDYVAYFERLGSKTWECGKTREEAIGKLVTFTRQYFIVRDEAREESREVSRKLGYARQGKRP